MEQAMMTYLKVDYCLNVFFTQTMSNMQRNYSKNSRLNDILHA